MSRETTCAPSRTKALTVASPIPPRSARHDDSFRLESHELSFLRLNIAASPSCQIPPTRRIQMDPHTALMIDPLVPAHDARGGR